MSSWINIYLDNSSYNSDGKTEITDPAKEHTLHWMPNFFYTTMTVVFSKADGTTETKQFDGNTKSVVLPKNYFLVGITKIAFSTKDGSGAVITANVNIEIKAMLLEAATPVGYVANELTQIFSWNLRRRVFTYSNDYSSVLATGGKLQWRDGAAGTVHSITIPSGSNSITVSARTFPDSADIQWRLANLTSAAKDNVTSEWYTITTLEAASSAAAIRPVDTTVDGAKDILFEWSHIIATGTAPTGFTLQISTDGSTWSTLAHRTGTSETRYTAAANRFTAGKLFWRVRTLNTDGAAGSWSETAEVTVIASPPPPAISIVSQAPRFSIRWATSGQQSYELMIDGALYVYKFGTEGNYRHDDFLSDGMHTVAVRVQNSLGLWSEWGTAALSIKNTPGAAINLLVSSLDTRAILAWSGGSYDEYWVYRDGVRIAKTADTRASDDFAVGKSSYYVIGFKAESGNYTKSNTVETETPIRDILITDIQTRETAVLRWTERSSRMLSSTRRHSVVYTHYAGSALPEAEIGESRDRYYELTAAFRPTDVEEARKFAAMAGRLVCIRDMQGDRFFGIYDEISVRDNLSYLVCAATARAVRYSEG